MRGKVLTRYTLENNMDRLKGCRSLLSTLHMLSGTTEISEDALYGACDLLDGICKDFQAAIDTAEDYAGEASA